MVSHVDTRSVILGMSTFRHHCRISAEHNLKPLFTKLCERVVKRPLEGDRGDGRFGLVTHSCGWMNNTPSLIMLSDLAY